MVVAAFHHRRVLPLMAWRRCLFEMRPDEPIKGIRMSTSALFDEEILRWVREMVEAKPRSGGLTPIVMHPSWGFLSLTGEGAPLPCEAEARESDGAKAPSVAEATEVEAPRASKAEATEAGVPRTIEAAATAGAPGTTEATVAEADVSAAKSVAQELEMKAAEASVAPLVQGLPLLWESAQEAEVHPISSNDTSWAQEVVDAEVAGTMEQLAPTLGEGSSALVQSVEVEDLCLCGANMKAMVMAAQEQVAPLAARVKELEEELTRMTGDRDAFRSRAGEATASIKALAGQLGTEQGAHQLMKGALDEALKAAEASQTEAMV
ncbi:uncharacterized protein [Miscanthus floridulus]|uniref:uncharacterized protein n=1 Tax=Miscanthus floridulus TaxID=154761 RepID=UPI003457D5AE